MGAAPPPPPGELRQEAHVALEEQPDVGDAVAHHGDALRPHPEGEAGVALRVHAAGLEDRGVYHAAPQDLDPARLLAGLAARPTADRAARRHASRRLGEREERGREAGARPW